MNHPCLFFLKFIFCPRCSASRPRFSYLLFQLQRSLLALHTGCVIVGSTFDENQSNKTRLVNIFNYRETIAKLKTWALCTHTHTHTHTYTHTLYTHIHCTYTYTVHTHTYTKHCTHTARARARAFFIYISGVDASR